jgi:hypothetical protein
VSTADISPVPGASAQFAVEIHLTDASNTEQYCRWKGVHYTGGRAASQVDIKHGDDVEILLTSDGKGGYTRDSYVHNHTRNLRYTFSGGKRGCASVLALVGSGLMVSVAIAVALG